MSIHRISHAAERCLGQARTRGVDDDDTSQLAVDDVWKLVFGCHLGPDTLSVVRLVSKRFNALSTSEDVFRLQCMRFKGSDRFFAACGKAISWRQLFRNLRALNHPPPSRVPDFNPFPGVQVSLLSTAFVPSAAAVFYDAASDLLRGWPSRWTRSRVQVLPGPLPTVFAARTVSLKNGDLGFVDTNSNTCVFLDPLTGSTLRTIHLPLDSAANGLSTTWTHGAVHNSPVCLRGGLNGTCLIYSSGNTIYAVDGISGMLRKRWPEVDSPFAALVRGPNNDALGVAVHRYDSHGTTVVEIQDVETATSIKQFGVPSSESIVDVVMSTDGSLVGCRVVARSAQLVVAVLVCETDSGVRCFQRHSLCKLSENYVPKASHEFAVLANSRGVVYKAEKSVDFRGPMQVMLLETESGVTTHTLKYARVGGSPFRSATISSDGSILMTCAANGTVSCFHLESGRCFGSFPLRTGSAVVDAFFCGMDHAFVVVNDSVRDNIDAFHFDRYCDVNFPMCLVAPNRPSAISTG